jgi:hypothetical protein
MDDYVDLICNSDVGLFLYDGRQYYARCSGVLVEMLAAGVPVIVPAGSWLADQIAAPIQRHLNELEGRLRCVGRCDAGDLEWESERRPETGPDAGGMLRLWGRQHACAGTLSLIEGATEVLVTTGWPAAIQAGTYLRVEARQEDARGEKIADVATIVAGPTEGLPVAVLVRVRPDASRLRLAWSNAYDDSELGLSDVRISFLSSAEQPKGCPAGAVGLIATELEQVGDLLTELIAHYPHYRRTAGVFAAEWSEAHDPKRTVATILSASIHGD